MPAFNVTSDRLRTLADEIRGGSTGIKSELDTLESEVGRLRGAWTGGAQAAYDDAQRKWTQSLTALNTLLEQISAKTIEIADHYDHSDKSSASRFSA